MKKNGSLMVVAMVVLVAGLSSPSYGDTVLAEWGFNEGGSSTTTADASGNGNTGTLSGGTAWTGDATGRTGLAGDNALSMDGAGDYVSVPYVAPGNLTDPRKDITLEAWLKPTDTIGRYHLISKYYSYSLQYDRQATTDRFYFVIQAEEGTGREAVTHTAHMAGGTHLSTTEWTHIKAVYDSTLGTDTMRVFVDGTRAILAGYEKDETRDLYAGNTHQLGIGAYITSSGAAHATAYCYDGLIDDVKISMVPEPTTMVLLGVGGVGLLVRRHRGRA